MKTERGRLDLARKMKKKKSGNSKDRIIVKDEEKEEEEEVKSISVEELDEDEEMISETNGLESNFSPGALTFALADSTDWSHGSFAVTSKKSGEIKVYAPEGTVVGDTLFLFLR